MRTCKTSPAEAGPGTPAPCPASAPGGDGFDQLAAEAVAVAQQLVGLVRDGDRAAIGKFFGGLDLTEQRWYALAVMLACMVDDEQSPADLLAWMTWTDPGQPVRAAGRGRPLLPWKHPDAPRDRFAGVPLRLLPS